MAKDVSFDLFSLSNFEVLDWISPVSLLEGGSFFITPFFKK